jgi:hypothetical protein
MYNAYIINGNNRTVLHEADPASTIKVIGTIKKAVNSIDSFSFTVYQNNPAYNNIQCMTTIVELYKAEDGKRIFRGRVLKPTAKMDNSGNASITYVCESELAYLNDTVQPYQHVNTILDFFTAVLATHNSQVPDSKKIYLGTMDTSGASIRSRTWHYLSSWQAIVDYIKDYGGEIRLRYGTDGKRYLDYTSGAWSLGSDTKIELAVNMMSVSFTIDPTQMYSGIYAVGAKLKNDGSSAERLELGEVIWDSTLRAKYGDIVACVEWDDVTVAANLRTKAAQWLADQKGELHQYTVSAVELHRINKSFEEFAVGTQYAIKNELIGLDDVIRCISKTVDINDITKCTMTFGDRYETLTSITSSRNRLVTTKIDTTADEISRTQSQLAKQIVDNQTALITGAEGGYVYQHLNSAGKPQEIFFLNSADINTATQAIRINQNGIGFWSATAQTPAGSAMTGPYKNAWTIDGTFNTDYIVGRQITGFTFDNGNGTFKVEANGSVTANSINITGGSIHVTTNADDYDQISVSYNQYSNAMSPIQLKLENSTTNDDVLVQAGGIWAYHNNVTRAYWGQEFFNFNDINGDILFQGNKTSFNFFDNNGDTEMQLSHIALQFFENGDGDTEMQLSHTALQFFENGDVEVTLNKTNLAFYDSLGNLKAYYGDTSMLSPTIHGDAAYIDDVYIKRNASDTTFVSLRDYINSHP